MQCVREESQPTGQRPPVSAEKIGNADDDACRHWQRRSGVVEQRTELGDHGGHQDHDRHAGEKKNQDRVLQGRFDVLANGPAFLQGVGKAREHGFKITARFPRPDHAGIKGREDLIVGFEGIGQRRSAPHRIPDAAHKDSHRAVVGDVRQRRQRPFEGKARVQQGRQFPRQQRYLLLRGTAAQPLDFQRPRAACFVGPDGDISAAAQPFDNG